MFHKTSLRKLELLLEGSLFFRGLVAIFEFFAQLMGNSFIGRAFVGDPATLDDSIRRSVFARVLNFIFNHKKPLAITTTEPLISNQVALGSWVIGGLFNNLDINLKSPFSKWALFAFPAVGMAGIIFATAFLPTMVLAAGIIPVFVLVFLSRRFVIDGTAIFIFMFIIVSMIGAVLSLAPVSSIQIAILTSAFMLSTLIITAIATQAKTVDLFMQIFIVAAGLTGVYGIYQVLVGYQGNVWLDETLFAGTRLRVFSTFGNPNVYGTYLLLAIPIAAAGVVYFKHWFIKLCAAGVAGLLVINLVLTMSRGCYLSLAIAVGFFVLIIEKRLVVLFVPAVLALPLVLPPAILNRVLSIVNMADTSTAFRLNIWRGSIRIVHDFWLGGVGQGIDAYNAVYPYYSLAAIHSPHSHSLYIQYLVELGVFGLIVFVGIMACFFRTMAHFIRATKDMSHKIMATAMVAAVIGFLFQGVTDFVFYNYRVLLSFYIFIGISIAFTRVHMPKGKGL